jgi:hypothetical protein
MSENKTLNIQFILVALLAVFFSWELHEFFHWLTGTVLGNAMTMTLNSTFVSNGKYLQSWHSHLVDAVGPLITLVEAIICFFLIRKSKSYLLFPFLLTCLYMRALAGVMNIIHPNDEGRLSLALGTDVFFVSLLIVGFLFYLTYKIVKLRNISVRHILISLAWIVFFSSILIMSDQFFKIRIF